MKHKKICISIAPSEIIVGSREITIVEKNNNYPFNLHSYTFLGYNKLKEYLKKHKRKKIFVTIFSYAEDDTYTFKKYIFRGKDLIWKIKSKEIEVLI